MSPLVTALLLVEPALTPVAEKPAETQCYFMRIMPIPKGFRDPIALRMGPSPAALEQVRPNCWASPSVNLVRKRSPAKQNEPSSRDAAGPR